MINRIINKTVFNCTILLFYLLTTLAGYAQGDSFVLLPQIKLPHDSLTKAQLLNSIELFLKTKDGGLEASSVVESHHYKRYKDFFNEFKGIEQSKRYNDPVFFKCYLTNIVQQPDLRYLIQLSYYGINPDNQVVHLISFSMLAAKGGDAGFQFYCPFQDNIRHWKRQQIGNIRFFYLSDFDVNIATDFELYNTSLANKLGMQPLQFDYYKCQDIQEVYALLGINYDLRINGDKRSGFFDTTNKVFLSGTNSEQYKHDLTHAYFSLLAPDSLRSWTAEEAYNICTTDYWGESSQQIFQYLKDFLKAAPNLSVSDAFDDNPMLKYPIPIKYPIAAVLMRKVEREFGFEAVRSIILTGESDDAFLAKLAAITGIRKTDFNAVVRKELGIN